MIKVVTFITSLYLRIRVRVKPREHSSDDLVIRNLWSSLPINEKLVFITRTSMKRNYVASIKLLVFDETAPAFSHYITLATVPVGVTETP
ncbi:hypothetical protein HID58_013886 [Brassica napus]|uniref:Uncharacterized protein n=1 Tax=Brassica napus TaxID=3708 RepID=A0ABQ8DFM4_BRANA|nr:hypothetical protein HID58_013886 [Brassica napus]